jgi:bifunctional DNA-binding transcriptional regulator/antitoxin component of YhaV-PrlF toxin-antitoxin module
MEIARIGKKGQLTIPRSVLRAAGITEECRVVLEATADGAIVMRRVTAPPVESYSRERVREFEESNSIPAALEDRVQAHLRKKGEKR